MRRQGAWSIVVTVAFAAGALALTGSQAHAVPADRHSILSVSAGPHGPTSPKARTEHESRRPICENSDDDGKAGAKGCFVDQGDDFHACDIHRGASGTAWVQVTEWTARLPDGEQVGKEPIEEDNATDGVKVLGDCDEGPNVNINEGNWLRMDICLGADGRGPKAFTCDQRWIAE